MILIYLLFMQSYVNLVNWKKKTTKNKQTKQKKKQNKNKPNKQECILILSYPF